MRGVCREVEGYGTHAAAPGESVRRELVSIRSSNTARIEGDRTLQERSLGVYEDARQRQVEHAPKNLYPLASKIIQSQPFSRS